MFPSKLFLCVDSVEHFDTCKNEVAWLSRHLGCDLVLFHAAPEKWLDAEPGTMGSFIEEEWLYSLVGDPALFNIQVEPISTAGFSGLIDSILAAARESGADLIVVPTHARTGFDRLVLGSVAERVLRSCAFPVLTLDLNHMPIKKGDVPIDRIVCTTDLSETSLAAIHKGIGVAKKLGVGVSIFHSISDYYVAAYPMDGVPSLGSYLPELVKSIRKRVNDLALSMATEYSIECSAEAEVGSFAPALHRYVEQFTNPMVVMATAGRDSLGDFFLGSQTERVVRTSQVPVLSLPIRPE